MKNGKMGWRSSGKGQTIFEMGITKTDKIIYAFPFKLDIGSLDKGEYTLSWYERITTLIPRPLWRRLLRLPAKPVVTWHPFTLRMHVKDTGFEIGPGGDLVGVYHNVQLKRRDVPSEYIETAKKGGCGEGKAT